MDIIMGTATNLHYKHLSKYEHGGVWPLWRAIEAQHVSHDASLHHEAWMQPFSIQKRSGESYLNLYRCINNARSRIDHITPTNQSCKDHSDEIAFFTLLSALHTEDPLCWHMVSQKGITNANSAFLHTDRDTTVASEIESASAAYFSHCHRCEQPGHYAETAPASRPSCGSLASILAPVLVATAAAAAANGNSSNNKNNKNNNKNNKNNNKNNKNTGGGWQRGRGGNAANANTAGTSSTSNTKRASTTQETAG